MEHLNLHLTLMLELLDLKIINLLFEILFRLKCGLTNSQISILIIFISK